MKSGGFDLRHGWNLAKELNGATEFLQYIAPTENNRFDQIYAYDPDHISHKTSDEDMYPNMEYEMYRGTKLDYLFSQSLRLFQVSQKQLSEN